MATAVGKGGVQGGNLVVCPGGEGGTPGGYGAAWRRLSGGARVTRERGRWRAATRGLVAAHRRMDALAAAARDREAVAAS